MVSMAKGREKKAKDNGSGAKLGSGQELWAALEEQRGTHD